MISFDNISSTSAVRAKVELYNGSTLAATCACSDYLQDFVVNRQGDTSKFFGFGICQKLSLNLIDIDKQLPEVTTDHTIKVHFGDGTNFGCPYPTFYISEVNRNERDRTITCTAYDRLNIASQLSFADLGINTPYTFRTLAQAIASHLGVGLNIINDNGAFETLIDSVNLDEDNNKTVRNILDNIAECTQSIYFINYENRLTFKRLAYGAQGIFPITKDLYFELDTQTAKVLTGICHTTELGDNVIAGDESGTVQYVRNNPFWELRTDIGTLLDNAYANTQGCSITQFRCDWDGNYTLEIGDGIELQQNDDSFAQSYLLNDTITYDGTLSEITEWIYSENDSETASNPSTLGEKLNQTFARVDKVNKEIELLITEVDGANEQLATLKLTTDSINLKVLEHEEKIEAFEELETGQIVDRMAQIEIELDGINTIVSENTTKVEAIEADNEEINDELTTLKAADTALGGRIDSTQSRISGVEVELDTVKTTVSNQSTKISALESEDAAIKGSIQENSNAIGQLEVTTQNINASVSQANSKITTLTNTTNGLTTTTNAHTEQIGALEVSTSKISASVSSNTAQIQSTANEVAGVKQTASSNTTKIGTIEASLEGINLTVSNQSSKITSLETTTSNQGTAIDNLTDAVEETATSIVTLTETTEEHTSKISQIETDLDSIDLSVKNQTSKITTLETKTTQQGTAINELTEEVEEHTSQIAQLQIDTDSIEASVSANTTQINNVKDSVSELEETTETHTSQISALQVSAESISATVTNITATSIENTENFNTQIEQLTQEVSTKITAEDVNIAIKSELDNGVEKVETTTGFTFNEEGLTISKSGREMTTTITEDGMTVYRDTTAVLTADNTGVDAKNLKASTYLIIGTNSRFENYGTSRTACFWIGD